MQWQTQISETGGGAEGETPEFRTKMGYFCFIALWFYSMCLVQYLPYLNWTKCFIKLIKVIFTETLQLKNFRYWNFPCVIKFMLHLHQSHMFCFGFRFCGGSLYGTEFKSPFQIAWHMIIRSSNQDGHMRTSAVSVPKQKDIHTHLFGRVQRLEPSVSVTEYLLFNMPILKQPQNAQV